MTPRLAKSLVKLREQVDARWPGRRTDSDGWIGDVSHAARHSDHNPDADGVVTALDITHDPRSGCDSHALAETLIGSRDYRIEYVISNGRICSSEVRPWVWRKYYGANPHDHHMHVSVKDNAAVYDDEKPWNLAARVMPVPDPSAPLVKPTLREGMKDLFVSDFQRELVRFGIVVEVDGVFGPATLAAVKHFQRACGLSPDGIVGPQTWKALKI